MVGPHVLDVIWILLHIHKVLNVLKDHCHNAIVICDVGKLRVEEVAHQGTGAGCVVRLLSRLLEITGVERGYE